MTNESDLSSREITAFHEAGHVPPRSDEVGGRPMSAALPSPSLGQGRNQYVAEDREVMSRSG